MLDGIRDRGEKLLGIRDSHKKTDGIRDCQYLRDRDFLEKISGIRSFSEKRPILGNDNVCGIRIPQSFSKIPDFDGIFRSAVKN